MKYWSQNGGIRKQTFKLTHKRLHSLRDLGCLQAAFDSRLSVDVNLHRIHTNLYSAVLCDLLPWLFTISASCALSAKFRRVRSRFMMYKIGYVYMIYFWKIKNLLSISSIIAQILLLNSRKISVKCNSYYLQCNQLLIYL